MKITARDDYWPPRPGSWEEAVDPYDVQFSRKELPPPTSHEKRDIPLEMMVERRPKYSLPASV